VFGVESVEWRGRLPIFRWSPSSERARFFESIPGGWMSVLDGLLDDLRSQRNYVEGRSAPYARILELLPGVLPREELEEAWSERTFGAWYERPLLILASLRYDALVEGPSHPLYAALVDPADPDAVDRDALRAAFSRGRGLWRTLSRRHVQTNETSRAVAWLWPARLVADVDPEATLHLFDVGASAGLNLIADALPTPWTLRDGSPLVVTPLPPIGIRRGFDLRPLDAADEKGALWLRACVWPGQGRREERLLQAVEAWRSADPRPELVAAAASEVPSFLPAAGEGEGVLAFQTVVRDYLDEDERATYEAGMREWLASSPAGRALWVELEVRDEAREGGPAAALTVHDATGALALATCEAHPRVLDVDGTAVRELLRRLH